MLLCFVVRGCALLASVVRCCVVGVCRCFVVVCSVVLLRCVVCGGLVWCIVVVSCCRWFQKMIVFVDERVRLCVVVICCSLLLCVVVCC